MADQSGFEGQNRPAPQVTSLTPEEKAVLLECRTHALYFRGIPIGLIAALGTRRILNWYVEPKYIKRVGPVMMAVSFVGGAVFGISTYAQTCIKNILALENSPLADSIRENIAKKNPSNSYGQSQEQASDENVPLPGSSAYDKQHMIHGQSTAEVPLPGSKMYESDHSVRAQNNLIWDTTSEPSVNSPEYEAPKKAKTYEELRKKHRESHQQQYQPPPRRKPPPPQQFQDNEGQQQENFQPNESWGQPSHQGRPKRNQYGDLIE